MIIAITALAISTVLLIYSWINMIKLSSDVKKYKKLEKILDKYN